ncbi:MAG: sugar transferase [Bacteroidales bacterium]|nr:sugar transferase [Bacteroidales bacterium]
MNTKLQTVKYLLADYISASLAWTLFFVYRKYSYQADIENIFQSVFQDQKFFTGIIVIPLSWVLFYLILGSYKGIYRKSRIRELGLTFISSVIGVSIIFFTLILDDYVQDPYQLFDYVIVLFFSHFGFTAIFRIILTSISAYKIHNRIIGFNTLIIGGNGKATQIFLDIENQFRSSGNKIIGFLSVNVNGEYLLENHIPHLGTYEEATKIIEKYAVEEVIIAIDPSEHDKIRSIVTILGNSKIIIKVIPDMHDILLGSVKMTSIFQAPLIQISPGIMPYWQVILKRIMDIGISIIAIIALLPVFIFTAIAIKLGSKGPIFYSQERIGIEGRPFKMLKFRTMVENAEANGPQLSSDEDPRITKFGKFMRKVRLDEIPQFLTVIKGDMALVGYRPERQFFIDKIAEKAPHYKFLLKIKPGITSWGQVKFGYASTVDEMIERLKYDILYIENMSIAVDIKIMIYTILIVFTGRGK